MRVQKRVLVSVTTTVDVGPSFRSRRSFKSSAGSGREGAGYEFAATLSTSNRREEAFMIADMFVGYLNIVLIHIYLNTFRVRWVQRSIYTANVKLHAGVTTTG